MTVAVKKKKYITFDNEEHTEGSERIKIHASREALDKYLQNILEELYLLPFSSIDDLEDAFKDITVYECTDAKALTFNYTPEKGATYKLK